MIMYIWLCFVVVRDTHDYGYLVHQDMSYYFMFGAVIDVARLQTKIWKRDLDNNNNNN